MRAFVITAPGSGEVTEVDAPVAGEGQAVVAVERVGLCGTDVEFFTGAMPYLHDGQESYPVRIGHEWAGRVESVGSARDTAWVGAPVTGDTMLGCGRCARCAAGRHHVCSDRYEIGIRGGWPGALAERLLVPVRALRRLPDDLPWSAGAMVEPAGSAVRAVAAGDVRAGSRVCLWGPGTLGLLALQVAVDAGADVDVVGVRPEQLRLAERLGARRAVTPDLVPDGPYDVVIDTSTGVDVPARAVEQVEPSGRVVLVGLAERPSTVDTRRIALRDVTVVGILAASLGLDRAIELMGDGRLRTDPLVARTVGLDQVADVLASGGAGGSTGEPKVLVDPTA